MGLFRKLCSLLFLYAALLGCSEEPGCDQDFFTPDVVRELADTNTPESLLLASVFAEWEFVQEKDPGVALPSSRYLRREALRLAPYDEAIVAFISADCDPAQVEAEAIACTLDWATRLRDLDPDNGFYWANLAHYQLSEGDTDAALESYRKAASSPLFSIGWGRQVYGLSTALQKALPASQSCAIELGVGIAAANLPRFEGFIKSCREYSEQESWRDACLNLGSKIENEALSLITRNIGFAMQKVVYEKEGDLERLEDVKARQEQFHVLTNSQNDRIACLWKDAEARQEWLINILNYDEMETMRRMGEGAAEC